MTMKLEKIWYGIQMDLGKILDENGISMELETWEISGRDQRTKFHQTRILNETKGDIVIESGM